MESRLLNRSCRALCFGLLCLAFSAAQTVAQVLPFEVLGLKEGLPQSQVVCLAQDAEGYIWVGTLGGLARYNGDSFTVFSADSGLPSNRVYEVLPARSGEMWVATGDGISLWKGHAMTEFQDPLLSGVRCRALAEDSRGCIWIGTDKGLVLRTDGQSLALDARRPGPARRVYDLLPESTGVLAVTNEGLFLYPFEGPPQALPNPPVERDSVRCVARTAEGLWVGTTGHGLWRQQAGVWSHLELGSLKNLAVYRLSVERSGTLYANTDNDGVYFKKPGSESFQHWSTRNGLPSDTASCTLEDREGNIWVGTDIGGLARLGGFAIANYGTPTGFPSSCVFGITPGARPDTLWIATLKGAILCQLKPEVKILETLTTAEGLDNDWVWKVCLSPQGELWVLTDFSLFVRKPGKKGFELSGPDVSFARGNAQDMYLDAEGRAWLAGDDPKGGFCLREPDGRWRRWSTAEDGSPTTNCRRVTVRGAGGVWVAVANRILWCDGNRAVMLPQSPPLPSQANITSLLEDSSGRLWAGNDGGLAVRETDGRWRLLNGTPGFSNFSIFSLGQDREGSVWVGTARGVFRFRSDGSVQPLMPEDGLAGYEANQNGFYCDPSGAVWIGTVYGLSRYEAATDRPNPIPPRIVVESADLKERSLPFPKSLELGWRDRSVVFKVALLAFRGHHNCGYRARMEGFEADWLPFGRDRMLRYTNLPPGHLSLVLQAANESGVWGETVRLPIRVRPPFWRTLWFYGLTIGLLVLLLGVGYRWRVHSLLMRSNALEQVVHQRTLSLQVEKERSDSLLHNILPAEVVRELQSTGKTLPREFELVTILFTDFQGFTVASATLPAKFLVDELNEIFAAFDDIADRNGLEKIRTIGDSYMAAAGVPVETDDHAIRCVRAGLEMQELLGTRAAGSALKWGMRVGIHSGRVVAGVVGKKKFAYDLWGDTVNIASRMEQSCEGGKVNISAFTYYLVKDQVECEYRGKVDIKGKGEVDMYYVRRLLSSGPIGGP